MFGRKYFLGTNLFLKRINTIDIMNSQKLWWGFYFLKTNLPNDFLSDINLKVPSKAFVNIKCSNIFSEQVKASIAKGKFAT